MLSDSCMSLCPVLSCMWHLCIEATRLDGARWNLACRWASALATLCEMGIIIIIIIIYLVSLCLCQHPQTCEWTSVLIQSQLMSLGQENFLNCGQCVRCTVLFYKCKLMWRPLNLSTVIIFPCYTVVLRNQNVFFNDNTRSWHSEQHKRF